MPETTQFTIGAEARCTDGVGGEVARVVVDPVAQAVTHLVVEPKHRIGRGRLVPLDLVDTVDASGEVQLRCTHAEFENLEPAEVARFLPGGGGHGGYGNEQALTWPYWGHVPSNTNWFGMGRVMPSSTEPRNGVVEAIPMGEIAIHRGEPVHATDGDIGHVQGLVITPDRHVTHFLLKEGHFWGRKQVAIPIGAVTRVNDGIRLSLTKQEVEGLPAIELRSP